MDESGNIHIPQIEGHRIHWLWEEPQTELYQHEASFISEELHDRYGQFSFHSDEEPVLKVADDTDMIELPVNSLRVSEVPHLPVEIENVLRAEQVLDGQREEALFSDELQHIIRANATNSLFASVTAAAVHIDTVGKHDQHEERIRQNESNLSDQASDPDYSGPLFVYKIQKNRAVDEVEEDDLLERRAPVNNAWNDGLGKDANDVADEMRKNGWNSPYARSPIRRYVITQRASGWRLESQNDQAGKNIGPRLRPDQWHCRLYDIPDAMDTTFAVAGQAHRDPIDHNLIQSRNWDFANSRQEVASGWQNWGYSIVDVYVGNDDNFSSSKGEQGQISP